MWWSVLIVLLVQHGFGIYSPQTDESRFMRMERMLSDMSARMEVLQEKMNRIEKGSDQDTLTKDFREDLVQRVKRHAVEETDNEMVELAGILRNISVNGFVTFLQGKDGNDGARGLPGIPGVPGAQGAPGTCSPSECQAQAPHMTYWNQENINNYLLKTNLPAMTEFTACFYYAPNHLAPPNINRPEDGLIQGLISIASSDDHNEMLLVIEKSKSQQALGFHGEHHGNRFTEQLQVFLAPHKHCLVWKTGHFLKWFYDINSAGNLELSAQVADTGKQTIPAGSALVLLNDQDSFGGSLDRKQMIAGNIADFQMWDRAFSNEEVRTLGCREKGNVFSFEDFDTVGTQNFQQGGNFQCSPRQ